MGLDAPDAGRALVSGRLYRDLARPIRDVGAHLDAKTFHPGRSAERGLLALAQANAIERSRVGGARCGRAHAGGRAARRYLLDRDGVTARHCRGAAGRSEHPAVRRADQRSRSGRYPMVPAAGPEAGRGGSHGVALEPPDQRGGLTADWLVVIGRGRLVAELSMAELSTRAPRSVRVARHAVSRHLTTLPRDTWHSVGCPSDIDNDAV